MDRDQTERFGGERIAQNSGDFHPSARTASSRFGQHELALLGPAQIGNRRRMAYALVNRSEPAFPALVDLDDPHDLIGRGRQLFHRMGDPARASLLGPCQDPVTAAQGGPARALFAQPQPRRRGGIVGLPAIRNGNCFAILNLDHPQHRNLGHAAHPVERAAIAIDQAFVGHILEQRLELDFLLPLQPERSRNLALAGWFIGIGNKFEDLLAGGKAGLRFGWLGQVNKPGPRKSALPPVRR